MLEVFLCAVFYVVGHLKLSTNLAFGHFMIYLSMTKKEKQESIKMFSFLPPSVDSPHIKN